MQIETNKMRVAFNRIPVTVIVSVKNEIVNIQKCLDRLGDRFAEIVVVDSSSSDGTTEIVKLFDVKYLNFHWNGKLPKKRNWVLQNYTFKTEWVLFLDADEFVTDEFLTEITVAIANTEITGYWLNYANWFLGRELNYGDPMRKLALFKVGAGEYEQLPSDPNDKFDMEVHEHPILVGKTSSINSKIDHRDFRGLSHYLAKHNYYSDWESQRYVQLHSGPIENWRILNSRQKFKYRFLKRPWFAVFYFLVTYFVKFGFLDGYEGFVFACMKWRYFSDIRLKILERQLMSTYDEA